MQVSWIDADQVTALAEGLRRGTAANSPSPETEIGTAPLIDDSTSFVFPDEPEHLPEPMAEVMAEEAPQPVLNDFRARLQAIRDRAIQAGLIPAQMPVIAMPEVELPPFDPQAGAVPDRLAAFIDWALPALTDSEIFIVDDQGDLHWGSPASSGLVLSAIMAWGAASRMSALAAYETVEPLRQTLATGRHLAVIPCATRLGIMHVAITSPQLVQERQITALRSALVAAMDADD
jgi:hypothetical protein